MRWRRWWWLPAGRKHFWFEGVVDPRAPRTGTRLLAFEQHESAAHPVAILARFDLFFACTIELTLSGVDRPLKSIAFASFRDAPCSIAVHIAPAGFWSRAWRAHLR